jgi:replicative DNA helicase
MKETNNLPPTIDLADLVNEFVADTNAAAAAAAANRPRGAITGLTKLDRHFGNYLSPGIHVLQGGPGAGKTAMALQAASDCRCPALFVSAEMGALELFRRLIARQTNTFLGRLKSGEISGQQAENLARQAVQKLTHLRIMDATRVPAPYDIIVKNADNLRKKHQSDNVLVVIDSLHVWARSASRVDSNPIEREEYSLINDALKSVAQIASVLKCPVLTVAHRNRAGNKSDGGLHAAKGSGGIEYEAESVLDLNKNKEVDNANGEAEITAKLEKNRNGAAGVFVKLAFNGALQSFREL